MYIWGLQNYGNHNNYNFAGFPETTPAPFTGNKKTRGEPPPETTPGSQRAWLRSGTRTQTESPLPSLPPPSHDYKHTPALTSSTACFLWSPFLSWAAVLGAAHWFLDSLDAPPQPSPGAMPEEEAWGSSQWLAGPFAYELPPHFLIIEESTVDLLYNEHVNA